MADYAGAVAAMRARFEANWTATPKARIVFRSVQAESYPTDGEDPWVLFEVIQTTSRLRAAGVPGNHVWMTTGWVRVHIFTPINYGYAESLAMAEAAGEIFRAQTIYDSEPGTKVIFIAPVMDDGEPDAENGNWFRVISRIPFEFYFIK